MADSILQWLSGEGWLVFSGADGRHPHTSAIRSQALARASSDGIVAYLSLAEDKGDALMDDMEDLGAPTGYLVDLEQESPASITEDLKEASVIVIETGDSLERLAYALQGEALSAIRQRYEDGALILVEGLATHLFGAWSVGDDGMLFDALGWVRNAFIVPAATSSEEAPFAQEVLISHPHALAIEIGAGSALALGAGGVIETWGKRQVTVSLGSGYA